MDLLIVSAITLVPITIVRPRYRIPPFFTLIGPTRACCGDSFCSAVPVYIV